MNEISSKLKNIYGKILIVEDNTDDLDTYKRKLSDQLKRRNINFIIHTANCFDDANKLLKNNYYLFLSLDTLALSIKLPTLS